MSMAEKFEVIKDKTGEYRFILKAANGEIRAVGSGYKNKQECLNGINSIRKDAPDAEIIRAIYTKNLTRSEVTFITEGGCQIFFINSISCIC